ncbi:hypothetical protein IFM89_005080 [Coptis chinensis]|uniref:Uncharacterized protein n=1 Tax=Coptis chinensis TaxID=261450 RepID=A0A835HII3_9MAGN|nr:hypothetical protein IFM89_005080 [Coptis chinensis]
MHQQFYHLRKTKSPRHIDSSLRALAAQVEGFGRLAIGGLHGPLYHVTTLMIDGRGQRIKFTGKGLRLKECEHVIICNLDFEGGRGPDVDGIQIKPKSRHIWIDRCSLRDYENGLIDITQESTDITISSIAQVKIVTGSKILRILQAHRLTHEIPKDMYHLERNRKDKDNTFMLIFVESRIHRLAHYYKRTKKFPPVWK